MRNYSVSATIAAAGLVILLPGCQRDAALDAAAHRANAVGPQIARISDAGRVVARAELYPSAGSGVQGTVEFSRHPNAVTIDVMLTGLAPGTHAIGVYEGGNCAGRAAATQEAGLGDVVADAFGDVNLSVQNAAGFADAAFDGTIVVHTHGGTDLACGVVRPVAPNTQFESLTSRVRNTVG